jgi:plastocyanin
MWAPEPVRENSDIMSDDSNRLMHVRKLGSTRAVTRSHVTMIGVVIIIILIVVALASYYVSTLGKSTTTSTTHTGSTATGSATSLSPIISIVTIPNGGGYIYSNYAPSQITVVIGVNNTVMWINHDVIAHTATSKTGIFNSGLIQPNANFTYTFTTAGVYPYYCQVHLTMNGTVTVLNPSS